ncbi:MAG: adenylate/guanylate cyclase domain-containing protein [Acidobacteria bacterium]|nr:adenylate/guanylate cyclase domain-containing protein [Acidobacteriota bacterium]
MQPKITARGGRIVKLMGDGLLAEFPSVVEAVQCAVEIKKGIEERTLDLPEDQQIRLRIGVNLGDIIIEGSDIYGDGVNIAARLESLADPGAICLSQQVYDQVETKLDSRYEDLGEQQVKNIARPIRVYRIWPGKSEVETSTSEPKAISLPDKPSIAVLPFTNMSGDPNQEYFADGMVEDIITALSHMRWLFVIARNSSFTYKGRAVDVKQVGRELGVRYVLEGSVRRAGNKVRISGQLIDAATGAHLWADRFDGALEDVFDLQDQVTENVVGAIAPRLEQAEIERAKRKPTESLDAYDHFLRGMAGVHTWERGAHQEALSHFYKAIELDPNFASAYGMAARCYSWRKVCGWMVEPEKETAEAVRLSRRAAELGRDDALALCTAGIGLGFVAGQLEDGDALIERALALNPNLAWAWLFSGWVKVWLGEPEVAIEHAMRAMRLSPHDPHTFNMQSVVAAAHFFAGRYSEALSWAKIAMREKENAPLQCCVAAAAAGLLGEVAEAETAMDRVRLLSPELRQSNLKDLMPLRRPDDFARWADGMRKAGLPE